jgi:hypothetical protein
MGVSQQLGNGPSQGGPFKFHEGMVNIPSPSINNTCFLSVNNTACNPSTSTIPINNYSHVVFLILFGLLLTSMGIPGS